MEQLKELKKFAPILAGCLYIVYVMFTVAGSRNLVLVMTLAFLALGVTCFIKKTKPIQAGLLGLVSLICIYMLVSNFFYFLSVLFSGYLNFFDAILTLVSLAAAALRNVSYVLLAVLLLLSWKKKESVLQKFWYAPAVISFLAAILTAATNFFGVLLNGYMTFTIFFGIIWAIIVNVVLSVAHGALALTTVTEDEPVIAISVDSEN